MMKRRTFIGLLGYALVATRIPPLVRTGKRLTYDPRIAKLAIRDPVTGTWIDIKGFTDGSLETLTNTSNHEVVLHKRRE